LNESVRNQVFFKRGNLMDPKCLNVKDIYDFIFCRNLLIYFDRLTQAKVLQKLKQLLTPAGLCFLGPAELPLIANNGFVSANIPMAFACRKAVTPLPPPPERRPRGITPLKAAARPAAIAWPPAALRKQAPAKAGLDLGKDAKRTAAPRDLNMAQRLADAGKLGEAEALCEAHLREEGPSARAYYLLGLLCDAAGQTSRAIANYRKTLYLQPKHGDALLQLALLAEKSGDAAAARLLRQRARQASLPVPSEVARQAGNPNPVSP
jgi:chemotaxis protein methyltransferase WspC